jgi:hypothetical protein
MFPFPTHHMSCVQTGFSRIFQHMIFGGFTSCDFCGGGLLACGQTRVLSKIEAGDVKDG